MASLALLSPQVLVAVAVSAVVVYFGFVSPKGYRRFTGAWGLFRNEKNQAQVGSTFTDYASHFGTKSRVPESKEHKELQVKREENYTSMVNGFYDLVTDFYEYAWGQSFHFAPRFSWEPFMESLRRHEYYLALKLGLKPGMKCADLGCGVGGPMRNIARFSGATVVGVNNSDYQVKICNKHTHNEELTKLVSIVKADYMHQPFADASFDAAYQIEATCHAPDLAACFSEIYRILKPGSLYAGYEWLMTKNYDPKNPRHNAIKQGVEQGNGIPNLRGYKDVVEALKTAGFVVLESEDRATFPCPANQQTWYKPLGGDMSWENLRSSKAGRYITSALTWVLEAVCIAPKGTYKVQQMLTATADDLVAGGQIGIFTPCYFFLARKPLEGEEVKGAGAKAPKKK